MTLDDFRQALSDHAGHTLRVLPAGGAPIADHFHVTEIGRIEKSFVDCGGKPRKTVTCVLQTLVAHDTDHRLTTDKLTRIVALADGLDLPGDTPVEVEHQERSVSVDSVDRCTADGGVLVVHLAPKQTACLAEDACGIGLETPNNALKLDVIGDHCDASGCC